MCSYLIDRNRGCFDTLLEQHIQYSVLLLQVKHTGPQLHTFLFQVLQTNKKLTESCEWRNVLSESDANLTATRHNALVRLDRPNCTLKPLSKQKKKLLQFFCWWWKVSHIFCCIPNFLEKFLKRCKNVNLWFVDICYTLYVHFLNWLFILWLMAHHFLSSCFAEKKKAFGGCSFFTQPWHPHLTPINMLIAKSGQC